MVEGWEGYVARGMILQEEMVILIFHAIRYWQDACWGLFEWFIRLPSTRRYFHTYGGEQSYMGARVLNKCRANTA
jgi:hypothetical protein